MDRNFSTRPEPLISYSPPAGFSNVHDGIYVEKEGKDGNVEQEWLCSHIAVVALGRNADHTGWSRCIELTDPDGVLHQWFVQPLGAAAWSKTALEQDQRIAELLRALSDPFTPTYAQVADLLNSKGLRTLHGKEWNRSRVRQPVARARKILRAEEDMELEADPRFGMF